MAPWLLGATPWASQAKILQPSQTFVFAVKCPGLREAVSASYLRGAACSTAISIAKGVCCILLLACSYHQR